MIVTIGQPGYATFVFVLLTIITGLTIQRGWNLPAIRMDRVLYLWGLFRLYWLFWAIPLFSKLCFDRNGCTISILKWSKHYSWNELKTIRYVDFRKAIFSSSRYGTNFHCEGVIFCKNYIDEYPSRINPEDFKSFKYLFSSKFFFIQFPTEEQIRRDLMDKQKRRNPNWDERLICPGCAFPVDKQLFLAKIEEWGVKVEGLNAPLPPEEEQARKKY